MKNFSKDLSIYFFNFLILQLAVDLIYDFVEKTMYDSHIAADVIAELILRSIKVIF